MSRPRKGFSELELSGSFAKHPERRRERENEPMPRGELPKNPPSYFTPEQAEIWRELRRGAPDGVLTDADYHCVELACILMAKVRAGEAKPSEIAVLSSLLARLGLTPADRNRVRALPRKPQTNDEWCNRRSNNEPRCAA